MKIGAMVPQGWRMDLHGIDPKHQWDTILESSSKIENIPEIKLLFVCNFFSNFTR